MSKGILTVARGWTLDVLNVVRGLAKSRSQKSGVRRQEGEELALTPCEFTLAEVYAHEAAPKRQ